MGELGLVMVVLAAAAFAQSITGFGAAMIFMPVAAHVLGMDQAAPLMGLMGPVLVAVIFYNNRHAVHWGDVLRLVLASLPGLVIGLLVLKFGSPDVIKRVLGALLVAYTCYALFVAPRLAGALAAFDDRDTPSRRWGALLTGLVAGFFGGACAINGPPLVVYLTMRRTPADRFKSVLQGFFLLSNVTIVTGHALSGLITREVLTTWVYLLPALGVGLLLGTLASRYIQGERFRIAVLLLIGLLGGALLLG